MKDSYESLQDARDDFMKHCSAMGGNWTAMLWTGIREVFPDFYKSFPNEIKVSFSWLCDMISVLLSARYDLESDTEYTIIDLYAEIANGSKRRI